MSASPVVYANEILLTQQNKHRQTDRQTDRHTERNTVAAFSVMAGKCLTKNA